MAVAAVALIRFLRGRQHEWPGLRGYGQFHEPFTWFHSEALLGAP